MNVLIVDGENLYNIALLQFGTSISFFKLKRYFQTQFSVDKFRYVLKNANQTLISLIHKAEFRVLNKQTSDRNDWDDGLVLDVLQNYLKHPEVENIYLISGDGIYLSQIEKHFYDNPNSKIQVHVCSTARSLHGNYINSKFVKVLYIEDFSYKIFNKRNEDDMVSLSFNIVTSDTNEINIIALTDEIKEILGGNINTTSIKYPDGTLGISFSKKVSDKIYPLVLADLLKLQRKKDGVLVKIIEDC